MREVLPLAPAPDAAALKRAAAAVKLQAIKGARRLVLVDGVFAPKLSELGRAGEGADHPHAARRAGGRRRRAAGAAVHARQRQSDGGAQQRDDDRWRGDRDRQRRRADAAAAYHSCRQRRRARGDVHALAAAARQGCRRDAGRKLHRGRWREGLSGPRLPDRCDRRQFAARPCPPDRGRPRGLQYFLRRRHAGRARAFQHLRHDLGRCRQPLSGDDRVCRRGLPGRDQRRQSAQRPPARRHHAVHGPRGAALRQPRGVPRRRSTTAPIRCSRAASSCAPMRRRPTPR